MKNMNITNNKNNEKIWQIVVNIIIIGFRELFYFAFYFCQIFIQLLWEIESSWQYQVL